MGDFDNDGDSDLAVACWEGNTQCVRAYINDFGGYYFYENPITYEGNSPYDIVSADFNGDNDDDLAVLDYLSRFVYIYTEVQACTGGLTLGHPDFTTPVSIRCFVQM